MSERALQIQLGLLAGIAMVITIASPLYIWWAEPQSLHQSRNGVPFFTPAVEHPDNGEAITVDDLVRHFKSGG